MHLFEAEQGLKGLIARQKEIARELRARSVVYNTTLSYLVSLLV